MSDLLSVLDFSKLTIVLALTIFPSIIMLILILYSDRKSREPLFMILICIFSGAFTICLSLLVDRMVMKLNIIRGDLFTSLNSYSVYRILILAGVEEYSKILILYLFLFKNKAYDDIYDGFVYSSIIALSFSLVETFMYVFTESTYNDMTSLAILRNFTAIPLHIACGIVMGHFVSLEKFSKVKGKKIRNMVCALLIPTLIHTTYNVFFSAVAISSSSVISTFTIILFILSVYFVGIAFIVRTSYLNNIYASNGFFPKRYSYLMRKNEFVYNQRRRYYDAWSLL